MTAVDHDRAPTRALARLHVFVVGAWVGLVPVVDGVWMVARGIGSWAPTVFLVPAAIAAALPWFLGAWLLTTRPRLGLPALLVGVPPSSSPG